MVVSHEQLEFDMTGIEMEWEFVRSEFELEGEQGGRFTATEFEGEDVAGEGVADEGWFL